MSAGASTSRHKPENCLTPIRLLVLIDLWQAEREKHVVLRLIFLVICPDGSTKPHQKKCGSTTSSNGMGFPSTSVSRLMLRSCAADPMTTKGNRAECPECGARLRRGQPVGAVCDPCLRKGPRLALPAGFYDAQPVAAALAVYDFGTVFLAIRAEQRWSQERLGEFVGLRAGVVPLPDRTAAVH